MRPIDEANPWWAGPRSARASTEETAEDDRGMQIGANAWVGARASARSRLGERALERLYVWLTGIGYILGGLIGGSSLLLGASIDANPVVEWALVACCVCGGVLILSRSTRPSAGRVREHISIAFGTALISEGVSNVGSTTAAVDTAALYLLPVLGCTALFPWLRALPHLVFIEGASMVAFAKAGVAESSTIVLQCLLLATGCTVAYLARAAASGETDALTGLGNRRKFERRLGSALLQLRKTGEPLSIAMLDLDDFKAVNDTHGHGEGDRVLVAVAQIWQKQLTAPQLLCRLGGDEFAVILPGATYFEAAELGAQLRAAAAVEIGSSVGVAQARGDESAPRLLKRTDDALYEFKDRRRPKPIPLRIVGNRRGRRG